MSNTQNVQGGGTLWSGEALDLPWGRIAFDWPRVTVTAEGQEDRSTKLPGTVEQDPFLEVFWNATGVFAAEAGGTTVIAATAHGDHLTSMTVERLFGTDHFDSGVHALRFFGVAPADAVLANEVGVALLSTSGLRWQHVHGDVTNRVLGVTPRSVELRGETSATSLDLTSGAGTVRPVRGAPSRPDPSSAIQH